jgi:putative DNA primase/helicase
MESNIPNEQSVIDEFLAAMRAEDIPVDEPIIADGKLHRYHVEGDRGRDRNAWAVLHIDAHPAGEFGCNKRYNGTKFPWSMKGGRDLTAAERAAITEKAKLRGKQRQAEDDQRHAEAAQRALASYQAAAPVTEHPYLTYKGVPSSPKLRVGKWYYIDEDTGEESLVCDDALLVPMMVSTTRILSLQAIMADNGEHSGFRKQFLKGGQTLGTFCTIGTPRDGVILICEGLATGLSLWQCTGHAVLVAFTSGNLDSVTRQVRERRPDTRILICADNDCWKDPKKNPGLTAGREAAVNSSALIVYPQFLNTDTKPTDFNDLHTLEGEAIVRSLIERALEGAPAEVDPLVPPPQDNDTQTPDSTDEGDDGGAYEAPSKNGYFAIMGYDHGIYYIFQFEQRQMYEYKKIDFNECGLLQLADKSWWEENFPRAKGGFDKRGATNFIFRTANRKGIFSLDKIRGRGAWIDQGRIVFHHGRELTVDGERVEGTRITGLYMYEYAAPHCIPADPAMTDDEGFKLLELAGKFRWTMPGSAALLMGWIVLAPFCGALKWRPHIWITGNAGSGKSTVINYMVNPLLQGMCLYGLGNSTEAGFRQMLKTDALPVLIDESEQNEERDVNRIQSILGLMRQSSTESQARTFKGTPGGSAMYWHIRSMFCLSSIQVGVKHQADTERVSILTLRPKLTNGRAGEQWEALRDEIHSLVTRQPDISGRLFRRTLDQLPTVLANVEVFKAVAARHFKSQRSGDQLGTLLAGCFALFSSKLATEEDAEWVIKNYVWTEHVESDTSDESARALECVVARPIWCGSRKVTVIELVNVARGGRAPEGLEITALEANQALQRHSMKVDESGRFLMIAPGYQEFLDLMVDTNYSRVRTPTSPSFPS